MQFMHQLLSHIILSLEKDGTFTQQIIILNHILFSKTNITLLSRLFTLNTPRYFLDFASYFSAGPNAYMPSLGGRLAVVDLISLLHIHLPSMQ